MKKILITGITGYIGGTVAQKLLDKKYTVIGLVRNEAHAKKLNTAGIETIVGSIHDEAVLQRAISGVDAVMQIPQMMLMRQTVLLMHWKERGRLYFHVRVSDFRRKGKRRKK